MSFLATFDRAKRALESAGAACSDPLRRFTAEIEFARGLADAHPDWQPLLVRAMETVQAQLAAGATAQEAVAAGEALLAPLAPAAKAYTIHCVGHAHIDMNWMWNWPETVATTNDTFTTVDRLMDEFPAFRFSQSQTSVYQILKEYLPELYARVKQRVAEGRWEVTASQWVEGDKNLASGEILCRHLLYSRRFFREEFGLPFDAVTIDWEPDTFGHAWTEPTILRAGGVRRYYMHRGGHLHKLFWWEAQSGDRLLVFDDWTRGYNGQINEQIVRELFEFERATGLKDFLFVYGVGDHGGGPTRRDLRAAVEMNAWPIFPQIKLSTTDAFFSIAEAQAQELPVVTAELNPTIEGCYTSESNIKRANRKSEHILVETEAYALLGAGLLGMAYPAEALNRGWRHAMFNQFHDILPGSGVKATYEYAQGLFQEILAQAGMIKTRALRGIAARIDTAAACGEPCTCGQEAADFGQGIGAGPGDASAEGGVTRRGAGSACCDPCVIFNPHPWTRSEVLTTRLWDRTWSDGQIAVRDDAGHALPVQVLERGGYWGHRFIEVAFPARDIPGLGYRTFSIFRTPEPGTARGCAGDGKGMIENEYYRLEVAQGSGTIVSLVDKASGVELVPPGGHFGMLEYLKEAPHPMTAWMLGQIVDAVPFVQGTIECPHNGPHQATVRAHYTLHDSTFTLAITLTAGSPRIDFMLQMNWLERGGPEIGVPSLKVAFPLAAEGLAATYEIPNGAMERPTDAQAMPTRTLALEGSYWKPAEYLDRWPGVVAAQKWAHLRGTQGETPVGITLYNDSKYAHEVKDGALKLTLVRSSYDPDPLPELGQHTIRFAIQPHVGGWSVADAMRAGYDYNVPLAVVGTTCGEGDLPPAQGFAALETPNVMLSALKRAEESDALIVRLYEFDGISTRARLRLSPTLAPAGAPAVQTDTLEQPLPRNTASFTDGVLEVDLPAFGMATVKIG